jgi:O-antigen/teichoic acid export membrane protein
VTRDSDPSTADSSTPGADHAPVPRDLHRLVVRGIGWMMASQGMTQLLALLISIVIARFLSPRELGLATEATVFVTLALVLVDFGFGAVIVQRPTLDERDISTAFWAGMALGVALALIGVGLSWPIASLYGEPRVQSLFAVLSLVFLVTAPGIVPGALLTRDLRFRSLETRTILALIASAAVAIGLAASGFGPWAVVAQSLTIASVSTLLLWFSSRWRPRASFSVEKMKAMAAFTADVTGTQVLLWAGLNLDNFLVGRFVGAAALGAYAIAFAIALTPSSRVALPVTQVFFPAFSRISDRQQIAAVWLRASRMVAVVVVPTTLGLVAVAPDFVSVVYGRKWHAAVPVLQLLAPIGLMQALTAINGGLLKAIAQTRMQFRFTVVATLVSVGAFAAGLPWGIVGVAVVYLAVTLALQPAYVILTARAVGISSFDWLRSIGGVLQAGIAMMLVVLLGRALLDGAEVPTAARLVALMILGACVYVALLAWRAPEIRTELRGLGRRRRHISAAPAE